MRKISGLKVFSATMYQDRAVLGERVTAWIAANPDKKLVEIMVRQSSDSAFHCISIIVFFDDAIEAMAPTRRLAFKGK